MNQSALKTFAQDARNKLRQLIGVRLDYGKVSPKGDIKATKETSQKMSPMSLNTSLSAKWDIYEPLGTLAFRQDGGLFRQTLWRPKAEETAPVKAQEARVEAQVGTKSALSRHQVEAQVKTHDEAHEPMAKAERKLLAACAQGPKSAPQLLQHLDYSERAGNFKKAISRLLPHGLFEMTIPDKPRSRLQKYRLTAKGRAWLASAKP